MSRLIVVSNRVADLSSGAQAGGLAVAIGDALREGSGLWFGWDGRVVADGTEFGVSLARHETVSVATQPLTQSEYDSYYLGHSNNLLWPIFHYRLDLAKYDGPALEIYKSVNARFAASLAALIEPGDLVWIHDYHLIPMAAELRKLGVANKIGFFLHIPFPPPDMLSAAPEHDWLVETLFAYDLLGFQTQQDCGNFALYLDREQCGRAVGAHVFEGFGRRVTARAFPIGIDVDAFTNLARTEKADKEIGKLSRGLPLTHIIGVDRLDYSKGLPDRFRAFRRLMEMYPEHRKTAVLMQIAAPTREELVAYTDIRSELEQLSGAINGEFGDFDWTPVRYIHRPVPRDTLAALFRGSKVGLVTPLRDGMNLVAKEYVAAQDAEDPGVLVLSQFAGAAEELQDALIVNPYDTDEVAEALHRAMAMPPDERIARHATLLAQVREHDIVTWRTAFLKTLREGIKAVPNTHPQDSSTV
ncbi:MAG: trehalose-6-phosphate synthase [Pseudomonadota bacterium]